MPGNYQYQVPIGVDSVITEVLGGGAGGTFGTPSTIVPQANAAGGGGAGAYCRSTISLSHGTGRKISCRPCTLFITVGSSGLGGIATSTAGTAGGAGGASSVTTNCSTVGVVAGGGMSSAVVVPSINLALVSLGGVGGTISGSGFCVPGQNGQNGLVQFTGGAIIAGSLSSADGGDGGSSFAGAGGFGGTTIKQRHFLQQPLPITLQMARLLAEVVEVVLLSP